MVNYRKQSVKGAVGVGENLEVALNALSGDDISEHANQGTHDVEATFPISIKVLVIQDKIVLEVASVLDEAMFASAI